MIGPLTGGWWALMSKRPAFQFYPSDWRNEAGLRLCSIGARGLWVEMMCLMHDGAPYGHLTVVGRPISPEALARLVGEGAVPVKRWLAELRDNEVFSETEHGVIYSRRMVRDEGLREARATGGSAGGQHGHKGASHGQKGGRPRKEKPPLEVTGRGVTEPPPSSSSSSSSPSPTTIDKSIVGAQRAKRLPAGFAVPADWQAWARSDRGWAASDVGEEAAKFADYWSAKSGSDATKLDWEATWRNWCRNSRREPRKASSWDGPSIC